jgi:hypothetical protein
MKQSGTFCRVLNWVDAVERLSCLLAYAYLVLIKKNHELHQNNKQFAIGIDVFDNILSDNIIEAVKEYKNDLFTNFRF